MLFGDEGLVRKTGLLPEPERHYSESPEYAVIEVPPDLQPRGMDPIYPIPPVNNTAFIQDDFAVPRPTPLTAGADRNAVRIQSLGDERWALVSVAPGQLWPQVRAFLTSSGIAVGAVDPAGGLIDTQWVELQERALPTRFRFRIESGIQRNSSELHVLQQDQIGAADSWPEASSDTELESEMLRNVAQFIANSGDAIPVSMMADQAMGDSGRIALEDSDSGTRLILTLPFERAWASTAKGLEESGFTIDDRNRSEGVFYVTFNPASEEEGGWFGWIWDKEDAHPLAGHKYRVTIREEASNQVIIELLSDDGLPIEREERAPLLTLLKGNIS
jgi:outer membrane protein assembly factor BamC